MKKHILFGALILLCMSCVFEHAAGDLPGQLMALQEKLGALKGKLGELKTVLGELKKKLESSISPQVNEILELIRDLPKPVGLDTSPVTQAINNILSKASDPTLNKEIIKQSFESYSKPDREKIWANIKNKPQLKTKFDYLSPDLLPEKPVQKSEPSQTLLEEILHPKKPLKKVPLVANIEDLNIIDAILELPVKFKIKFENDDAYRQKVFNQFLKPESVYSKIEFKDNVKGNYPGDKTRIAEAEKALQKIEDEISYNINLVSVQYNTLKQNKTLDNLILIIKDIEKNERKQLISDNGFRSYTRKQIGTHLKKEQEKKEEEKALQTLKTMRDTNKYTADIPKLFQQSWSNFIEDLNWKQFNTLYDHLRKNHTWQHYFNENNLNQYLNHWLNQGKHKTIVLKITSIDPNNNIQLSQLRHYPQHFSTLLANLPSNQIKQLQQKKILTHNKALKKELGLRNEAKKLFDSLYFASDKIIENIKKDNDKLITLICQHPILRKTFEQLYKSLSTLGKNSLAAYHNLSTPDPAMFKMPKDLPIFNGTVPTQAFIEAMVNIATFQGQAFKIKENTQLQLNMQMKFISQTSKDILKDLIPMDHKANLKQRINDAGVASVQEYKNLFNALNELT